MEHDGRVLTFPIVYLPPAGQTGMERMYPPEVVKLTRSLVAGLAVGKALVSICHWLFADSIVLKLAMQALACEVERAWTKFGTAIAKMMAMINITIMISTTVKAAVTLAPPRFILSNLGTRINCRLSRSPFAC